MNKKIFYLHILKTAGSSMNSFLTSQFQEDESLTHIESKIDFKNEEDLKKADEYKVLSGHIQLPQMQNKLKVFNSRITLSTFRIPMEHVISHIAWVRKLGDESEKKRLLQHEDTVQKIVKKLLTVDLTQAKEITKFIAWLEKEKIYLFHDTQTKYLSGGGNKIEANTINIALQNLNKLDFVGVSERLTEFQLMLCDTFDWKFTQESIKENANTSYYGLNINDESIRKALQPLIQWDTLIYRTARERFIDDMHSFLAKLEKNSVPRFSSVKVPVITDQHRIKYEKKH